MTLLALSACSDESDPNSATGAHGGTGATGGDGSGATGTGGSGGSGGSGGAATGGSGGGGGAADRFAWEVTKGSCSLVYEIAGTEADEGLGAGVALAGDVDGDGVQDLMVASSRAVQIRSGKDGKLVSETPLAAMESRLLIALGHDLDGDEAPEIGAMHTACDDSGQGGAVVTPGNCTYGVEVLSSKTGAILDAIEHAILVASVDDRDGDGLADLVVTTDDGWIQSGDPTRVVFHSSATLATLDSITPPDGQMPWSFGTALVEPGDVDDDGAADLFFTVTDLAGPLTGIYARSGATGGTLWSDPLSIAAIPWGDRMIGLGDVDGDGAADVLVSDHNADPHGRVHAVSGRNGAVLWSDTFLYGTALDDLGSSGLHYGNAIAAGGDLDGDGHPDPLVGGPKPGFPIFFNGEGGAFRVLEAVSGAPLVEVQEVLSERAGTSDGDGFRFGTSLARVPDLDDDGIDEIAVSAPRAPHGSVDGAGRVLVLHCTP